MDENAIKIYSPSLETMHFPHAVNYSAENAKHTQVYRPGGADCWLVEYTEKGGIEIRYENGTRIFEGNVIICFPPMVEHNYTISSRRNHYWITFAVKAEWQNLMDWQRLPSGVRFLKLENEDIKEKVAGAFSRMVKLKKSIHPKKWELTLNLFESILLWLYTEAPMSAEERIDTRIQAAIEYCLNNSMKRIDLTDVAAYCHLSKSRFSHLFREEMGCSPTQYFENYRMQLAGEELIISDSPIASIAYIFGYDDPLYFSRIFKKHTGLSPQKYRSQKRKHS